MKTRGMAMLLCVLVCALALSGCKVLAPIPTSTPAAQGEGATPPAGTKRLYSLRMGDVWGSQAEYTILDEDGRVVMQGRNLSIIYNQATGMPQCIVAQRYETERGSGVWGGYSSKTYSALYDTEGNLLEDWQETGYSGGLGSYIMRWANSGSMLDGWRGSSYLYNIYTKERIYEGINYLYSMGDGQWAAMDGAGVMMGILDAQANAILGFPMQREFGYTYTWGKGYITTLQGTNAGCTAVLDANFDVLYTAEADVYLSGMGDWLVEQNWEANESRILDSDFEEVYAIQGEARIDYYDGETMLLYDYNIRYGTVLCDGNGNEIGDAYEWVVPGSAYGNYDAEQFVAYRDGILYMLDGGGNELARKEGECYSCEYVAPGRYVLYGTSGEVSPRGGSDDAYVLVDENLEALSDTYGFLYNCYVPYAQEEDGYLEGGWYSDSYARAKIDVLDVDGNIVLADVTEVQEYAADRFVVVWGFSCGLVDRQGNWLYKTSAFGVLEDE